MSLLRGVDTPPLYDRLAELVGRRLVDAGGRPAQKQAAFGQPAYNMAGTLYHAKGSDYVLLSVPNALVRGAFAAMSEPGLELPPPGPGGMLEAHVTVMRPEELALIGGADKVTERGKQFRYSLGRLKWVEPAGWPGMAKAFYLTVHSPELQALRRSYGLSSLPNNGEYEFHVTVGVVRRGVLGRGATAKGTAVTT